MEVVFKDYGVKFDLPEGVIYYNKNDNKVKNNCKKFYYFIKSGIIIIV